MAAKQDLVELETKIGFLEHTVDALNEVVVEQGRSLDRLEQKLALIESRLQARDDGDSGEVRDLADDKPPHY